MQSCTHACILKSNTQDASNNQVTHDLASPDIGKYTMEHKRQVKAYPTLMCIVIPDGFGVQVGIFYASHHVVFVYFLRHHGVDMMSDVISTNRKIL